MEQSVIQRGFVLIVARTRTVHWPVGPVAHDCVKMIFVRHGSSILLSEFGEKPVKVGDVVPSLRTRCAEDGPESPITVTTLYLDRDCVIDQVFWQHAGTLTDRWHAQDFTDELYSELAQILHILHLGENLAGMLLPWLDELVALSCDGPSPETFYRLEALISAVLDVMTPYVKTRPLRRSATQRKTSRFAIARRV